MSFALLYQAPGDARWKRGLVFTSRASAKKYRARANAQAKRAGVPAWRYRIEEVR